MYYVYNNYSDWEQFNTFAEAVDCAIEIAFHADDEARIVNANYVYLTDAGPVIAQPERVITVGTPYVPATPWNPMHPGYKQHLEEDYLADDRYF